MGHFETAWLTRPENLTALADLPVRWIDKVHERRRPGSSCSTWIRARARLIASRRGAPTAVTSATPATTPLFLFNQLGELERCALRPGNVHGAFGWRGVLEPVIARYRSTVKRRYFRGDAAFANPDIYEFLEPEGYAMRSDCRPTGSCSTRSDTCRSAGRATAA
jgi:hypothetical protein